ncbi:deoxynucleoside kinase [Aureitalea sp. L0-47]|uniref:AAA family ATPase n=1 Tax=Aureitalea sp. L0-47 TaxID=2816962 RepID=UPI002237A465|nr:deoxynucleoside kinase [Aureitalea sp. L0-47]MCW5518613.1 deoxynucleoside kinase [Aureitalea sp. L0-47]
MDSEGKIIAVVGAQSSGKSTLVEQIAEKNPLWKVFYEGESFPKFVTTAFVDPHKRIHAFLYFHNKWVEQYIEAERLRDQGKVVILDNYWLSNLFYIDTLINDDEKEQMIKLIENTARLFSPPDGIIYLDVDIKTMIQRIRERITKGDRFWENTEEWLSEPISVKRRYDEFFDGSGSMRWLSEETKILKIKATDKDMLRHSLEFIHQCHSSLTVKILEKSMQ